MNSQTHEWPGKQLALVIGATLLVAVSPIAIVWWLRSSGTLSSAIAGVLLATALSLGFSAAARLVWEKHKGSEDLLFSELMLWGFVHRWLTQRRLSSALDLLGPIGSEDSSTIASLDTSERAKLLERLVSSVETRDPYTHGHSRRVARHSWMIARGMGLSRGEIARIRTAAAIHDVGKVETPKAILHKAGRLTDAEYDVIKRHPVDGARMSEVLRDPELTAAVLHHHERLDGTGYPGRLAGEEIPLGARIIAVADTFDAITSTRAYRPLRSHREAIDILRGEAGTQLDPSVVRAFCRHYAGRRPLAAWSIVAGLPERVVTWLGSGVATAASVAKAVAVVTLVGGAAVTATTASSPHHKHAARAGHATANVSLRRQIAELRSTSPVARTSPHGAGGPGSKPRLSASTRPVKRISSGVAPRSTRTVSGAPTSAAAANGKVSEAPSAGVGGSSSGSGEPPPTSTEEPAGKEESAATRKHEVERLRREAERRREREEERRKLEEAKQREREAEKAKKEEERRQFEEARQREREAEKAKKEAEKAKKEKEAEKAKKEEEKAVKGKPTPGG